MTGDAMRVGVDVVVQKVWPKQPGGGFFEAIEGERLRVCHVGESGTSEDGWLYVQRKQKEPHIEGWYPRYCVRLEKPRDWPILSKLVAKRACEPAEVGYLRLDVGDRLDLLYRGSEKSGDAGWYFVRRESAGGAEGRLDDRKEEDGWIASDDVASASDSEVLPKTTYYSKKLVGVRRKLSDVRPTPRQVMLITFGLENCDSMIMEKCRDHPGGGAWIRFTEDDLRVALLRRAEVPRRVDVVVDARRFPDPEAMVHIGHVGLHHKIVGRIVRHKNFPDWLHFVKRRFVQTCSTLDSTCSAEPNGGSSLPLTDKDSTASIRGGVPAVTLATYCKAGKHRSVAVALVLKHIMQQEGHDCPDIAHLAREQWNHSCRGLCGECSNPPSELAEHLDAAYRVWLDLA